jgi:hypothetical protein
MHSDKQTADAISGGTVFQHFRVRKVFHGTGDVFPTAKIKIPRAKIGTGGLFVRIQRIPFVSKFSRFRWRQQPKLREIKMWWAN